MSTQLISPVGRLVQGSVHQGRNTDINGNPLVFKSGARVGQPREEFFFALAIEKTNPEVEQFRQQLANIAYAEFPNGEPQSPAFSWKYVDGDGVDGNGQPNSAKEGFAGCWVFKFKGSNAPTCWDQNADQMDPSQVYTGCFVRVYCSAEGNKGGAGAGSRPGIYLNHSMVQLMGYGAEIQTGPDGAAVFGQAAAPAHVPQGMSQTPQRVSAPVAQQAAPQAQYGAPQGTPAPMGGPAPATPGAPAGAPGPAPAQGPGPAPQAQYAPPQGAPAAAPPPQYAQPPAVAGAPQGVPAAAPQAMPAAAPGPQAQSVANGYPGAADTIPY